MNITKIHTGILTAFATLAVAAPASAQPVSPVRKGCVVTYPGLGSVLEPDGTTHEYKELDGKIHTFTCRDGVWVETVKRSLFGATVTAPIQGVLLIASGN